MKLSIITPYYNTLDETLKLSSHLVPQLNDEVEWIIVDDGCNERKLDKIKARVIHYTQNSGNPSVPRNLGLFYAKGEYIAFIDSDDDVTSDYVSKILEKIEEGFDYCCLSWISSNGIKIIINEDPPEWNTAVWNRVYNRKYIGDTRFPPEINYGEDKKFNEDIKEKNKDAKRANIIDIIYIYKVERKGSLTDLYGSGKLKYKKETY
jgi:glycosyltransferase involved in cell wall biosynthesis